MLCVYPSTSLSHAASVFLAYKEIISEEYVPQEIFYSFVLACQVSEVKPFIRMGTFLIKLSATLKFSPRNKRGQSCK